nr:uncharacterized protein LOC106781852 [Equus caballus]
MTSAGRGFLPAARSQPSQPRLAPPRPAREHAQCAAARRPPRWLSGGGTGGRVGRGRGPGAGRWWSPGAEPGPGAGRRRGPGAEPGPGRGGGGVGIGVRIGRGGWGGAGLEPDQNSAGWEAAERRAGRRVPAAAARARRLCLRLCYHEPEDSTPGTRQGAPRPGDRRRGGAERSLVVLVRSCTPTGADTYAALSPRTETGVPSRRGRGSPSGPTASPAGAAARARTPPTPGGCGGAGGARAQGRAGLRSRCHGPHTHPWALPASPQPRGPAQSPPRRLQPVGRRRRRGCDWVFRTRVERRAHSCPFSPLPPPPAHFPNLVVLKLSEKIRGI